MSSQPEKDANRPNVRPCTHGLCCRNAILPDEDPAVFQTLLDAFQPVNAFEESNVRELACAEWRLRRACCKALKELQSPRPPRNTELTKQSQTPAPPDPEPPLHQPDTAAPDHQPRPAPPLGYPEDTSAATTTATSP